MRASPGCGWQGVKRSELVYGLDICKKSTCAQKIFVERLPELCHPHAQRTKRLQKALCELGLKEGGQAGADTGSELGVSGSRDTILRLVHQSRRPAGQEPHVIGLDDWAWKRRRRYGTLICDLERGLPIDLRAFPYCRNRLGLARGAPND